MAKASPRRSRRSSACKRSVPAAFALLAGMQLDIFARLADRPRSAGEVAAALKVAEDRPSRLLYALVAAGLVERRGSEFRNTPRAAASLVRGRAGFPGDTHGFLVQLWQADLRTDQSIRSGKPAALHDFTASSDEEMRAMHSFLMRPRDLARRFDFSSYRSAVDIGGGSGGLLTASRQKARLTWSRLSKVRRTQRWAF